MYCRHCGKQIEEDSDFCYFCGEQVLRREEIDVKKEETHEIDRRSDARGESKIDEKILDVVNHKEEYRQDKLKSILPYLKENGCYDKAQEIEEYLKQLEKEAESKKNSNMGLSAVQIIGIMIAVLGIFATFFCMVQISNDMQPAGFAGIRGNYKLPFTDYERKQVAKTALSIFAVLAGIFMGICGKDG